MSLRRGSSWPCISSRLRERKSNCKEKHADSINSLYFFVFFRNDEVIAAVGLDYDPVVSAVAERLLSGKVITKKEAQYANSSDYSSFFIFLNLF